MCSPPVGWLAETLASSDVGHIWLDHNKAAHIQTKHVTNSDISSKLFILNCVQDLFERALHFNVIGGKKWEWNSINLLLFLMS